MVFVVCCVFFIIFYFVFQNSDLGQISGRAKPPEAAAGHDTLVLRTEAPEEAALRAAPQRGAAAFGGRPLCGLLWWRNLSPPACPVRTLMRHAG